MKIIVVNVNTSESMTGIIAEAVVGLGLATSKVSTYAPPDPKQITGWPPSQVPGPR
jgi:Asp/Glu/hydantoin racemase